MKAKADYKSAEAYLRRKETQSAANRESAAAARDIGEIPPVVNAERREECRKSLLLFLKTYQPATFSLPFSEDHLKVIARAEEAIVRGGLFAFAMPRGSGKTTIAELAALWGVLNGYRDFILFIGSDESSALQSLENIKVELETNDLLLEDFPEVAYPIRCLEGIAHRCNGQTYLGQRTHIGWTAKELVLPTIPNSIASGTIIKATGLTGRLRGMSYKRPDGAKVRPSMVILDDPQTDESAKSPQQTDDRLRLINGAVLGLAGPGKKIAAFLPCTVIQPDDLADRLLNREKNPQWQGERAKLVYSFPSNEKLWDEYRQIREDSLRRGCGISEATEFYRKHREEMDQGAVVAWVDRYEADELSAIQHAMNLRYRNESAFFAEYQNEPKIQGMEADLLPAPEIAAKVNGVPRGIVPVGYDHLTAFVDIQGKMLFWVVAAWQHGMAGAIVDYGAFPDQKRSYYTLQDAKRTLAREFPAAALEGQIYAGLDAVAGNLLDREWPRQDGAALRVGKMLIDANWGQSTDTVYRWCRATKHAAIVVPSHGKFVGASSVPFDQYRKGEGELIGFHWMLPSIKNRRAVRHVLIDTNFWKSFIHSRLRVATGDKGSLTLFGRDPEEHKLIADHLTAEYRVRVTGRGRVVDEWKWSPGKPDNHWFDGIVGCAAGASMLGVQHDWSATTQASTTQARRANRRKVSYL